MISFVERLDSGPEGQEKKWKYGTASVGVGSWGWELDLYDWVKDLQNVPENWDGGGSQEWMGVTLAETQRNEDIEPEETITFRQVVYPVEW